MKAVYFFLALSLSFACKKSEVSDKYNLSGRVLEVGSEIAIQNAIIDIYSKGYPTNEFLSRAVSDSDGHYELSLESLIGSTLVFEVTKVDQYELYQITQNGQSITEYTLSEHKDIKLLNLLLVPPAFVKLSFSDSLRGLDFSYLNVVSSRFQESLDTQSLDSTIIIKCLGNIQDSLSIYAIKSEIDSEGNIKDTVIAETVYPLFITAFDTLHIEH